MNINFSIEYDAVFKNLNGVEGQFIEGIKLHAPVSAGDVILWHGCELKVDFITHFVHGQAPTINAHIISGGQDDQ